MAKIKAALVKICGITNAEDAKWAVNLGADFVGINFFPDSPRKVSVDKAEEIVESLPSFVKSVGVFVNPEPAELEKVLKKVHLHILQLHGQETPEQIAELKARFNLAVWKAVRVRDEASLAAAPAYVGAADTLLVDAYKADQPGGTGATFDWDLAVKAKEYGLPLFLAGGLNPENVSEAIERVEPLGVDVASGVEKKDHPRKKDIEKMKNFIAHAKGR